MIVMIIFIIIIINIIVTINISILYVSPTNQKLNF
jgi:hypothetical protein